MLTTTTNKEAIRAMLEDFRADFYDLLDSISDRDWRRRAKSVSPLSVAEWMTHVVLGLQMIPMELMAIRMGQNLLYMPGKFDRIRLPVGRLAGMFESRRSIRQRFENGYSRALSELDGVDEDDWQRGSLFYDTGNVTVEQVFTRQPAHLAEHAETIRRILAASRK